MASILTHHTVCLAWIFIIFLKRATIVFESGRHPCEQWVESSRLSTTMPESAYVAGTRKKPRALETTTYENSKIIWLKNIWLIDNSYKEVRTLFVCFGCWIWSRLQLHGTRTDEGWIRYWILSALTIKRTQWSPMFEIYHDAAGVELCSTQRLLRSPTALKASAKSKPYHENEFMRTVNVSWSQARLNSL